MEIFSGFSMKELLPIKKAGVDAGF